jgi:hypothetical protein
MKILFLISIILLLLLLKKNIEPVILSCCGGIRLNHDFKETDPDPPKKVRRCMKDWNMPCTGKGSPSCCEGKDYCKSTGEGGKCKKKDGSGYYIYEDDTKEKVDYMPEREREDISERRKTDKDDDDDGDDDSSDSGDMEILNYVLIGIILIVILVLVGLFFFSGDDKSTAKSVLNKHGANKYGSDKHGANRYGSDRYGADKYGSDRYGSNRYGNY